MGPSRPAPLVIALFGVLGCSSPVVRFSATSSPTGKSPSTVAIADVDRDGRLDLVVTSPVDASVSVHLGHGDGTFEPRVEYPTSAGCGPLLVADFDGDGWPDLMVESHIDGNPGTRGFLRNRGDGTFDGPENSAYYSSMVQAADLNGDHKAEMLLDGPYLDVFNWSPTTPPPDHFLIASAPGVVPPVALQIPLVAFWSFPAPMADFDGDGTLDTAGARGYGIPIVLAYAIGDAEKVNTRGFASSNDPRRLVSADFNLDGAPDLASGSGCSGVPTCGVAVFLNDGSGGMSQHGTYYPSGIVYYIATGDVNGDGRPDLVFVDSTADELQVLTGAGNGRFNLNPILATGAGLGWVSIADLNADGKDDIVVANGGRDTLDVYLAD